MPLQASKKYNSPLWRLRHQSGTDSFLLGSMHSSNEEISKWTEMAKPYLSQVSQYFGETNLDKLADISFPVQDNFDLFQHLKEKKYKNMQES